MVTAFALAIALGTLLGTMILMFIGGGPAGTAGGIKVTTFVISFFLIGAEVRGETSVNAFDRPIGGRVQRQALTVALLGVAAVAGSTLVIVELTRLALVDVFFEVTSAFATVGLSTGITADLPQAAQLLLVLLMFLGRLGPRPDAGLHRVRRRLRGRQDQPAQVALRAAPGRVAGAVEVRRHYRRREACR